MRYAASSGEAAPALASAIRSAFVDAMHTATWLAIGGAIIGAIVTGVALVEGKPTGAATDSVSGALSDLSAGNRTPPTAIAVTANGAQR